MSTKPQYALWAADPHQFGPGKVHMVDSDDAERTLCGKWLKAISGKLAQSGRATCKICLNAVENRANWKVQQAERDREAEQFRAKREAESREWWARYNSYLQSPEWLKRRQKVIKRANGICEACLDRPAAQVHHLTYAHLFNEPCFELRAVCHGCHEAITELDRRKADPS